MRPRRLARRQFLRRATAIVAGVGLLAAAGCKQPVPPAEAVQTRTPATPTRVSAPVVGILLDDERVWLGPEIQRALRDHGFDDGRNVTVEVRSAQRQPSLLPTVAAELVRANARVIVCQSLQAVEAVQQVTRALPLVIVSGSHLVESKLIDSTDHPGRNLTGMTIASDHCARYPEWLVEAAPAVSKVGAFWNASEPASGFHLAELRRSAARLGLGIVPLELRDNPETLKVLGLGRQQGIQALIVIPGGFTDAWTWYLQPWLTQVKLPSIFPWSDRAAAGALIGAGPGLPALSKSAAGHVAAILRGAKPADLPVRMADAELAINLETARALGLTLPPTLLAQATEIVQ